MYSLFEVIVFCSRFSRTSSCINFVFSQTFCLPCARRFISLAFDVFVAPDDEDTAGGDGEEGAVGSPFLANKQCLAASLDMMCARGILLVLRVFFFVTSR